MGKTSIALATLKILEKRGMGGKTLLIAPLRTCYTTWPNEIARWTDFKHFKVAVLHGSRKEEALKSEADIYIINPEGLAWLLGITTSKGRRGGHNVKVDVARFKSFGFDHLIIDELSKFKDSSTVRFKSMKQVIKFFKRRLGLTGSPAAKNLEGLFGQCYMLDEGRTFGPYITAYRNKYFIPEFNGFGWRLREGADKEIYKAVKPLALRMDAADYLQLPRMVVNDIFVELPPEARKLYTELEKDLITELDGRKITAANSGVAVGKCRQLASGAIYLTPEIKDLIKLKPGEKEWAHIHDAKLDALEDLVDELQGEPLLIAYEFRHDLERLQKRFGKDLPYIGAGVSAKRGAQLEQLWNAGKLPLMAGHPQSMAHGLNLQGCGWHVCHLTLTWDFELFDQLNKRVLRQGNPNARVMIHKIKARNTIDEDVDASLSDKDRGQKALFNALRSRFLKGRINAH